MLFFPPRCSEETEKTFKVKQARFAARAMLSAELGHGGSRHLGVTPVLADEETEGQSGCSVCQSRSFTAQSLERTGGHPVEGGNN